MGDLGGEEVEKPLELVGVPPQRRRQLRRVGVGRGLDGANLDLEPAPEALDPAEHADGISFGEAAVEQLDVVPDPRLDPAARVDELERQIGCAAFVRRRSLRPTA